MGIFGVHIYDLGEPGIPASDIKTPSDSVLVHPIRMYRVGRSPYQRRNLWSGGKYGSLLGD